MVLCFDVFCAGRNGLSWFAVVFCCPVACAASQVVDLLSDVFVMVVVSCCSLWWLLVRCGLLYC